MTNAYTKVPSAQLLDACPAIFAASRRFSSWLEDIDLEDFLEDYTKAEQIDDKIYTFLRTLNNLGQRPTTSQLHRHAVELFDAAHRIRRSICVFDCYVEEHPQLSLDAYQADRDGFEQSLANLFQD